MYFIGGQVQNTSGGINPGIIYRSDELLSFWAIDNVAESIRDFSSYSDSVVFGVGANGYIIVNQELAALKMEDRMDINKCAIYPNPNGGEFTIHVGENKVKEIKIYTIEGKLIYSKINPVTENQIITISKISQGVYSLHLKFNNQTVVKQFITN
jgi:hypothetical protein